MFQNVPTIKSNRDLLHLFFTACPAGTFKPIDGGPGDRRSCLTCPGRHRTSPPGSTKPEDCRCADGYELTEDGSCRELDCPPLIAPDNGFFAGGSCTANVLNAACGTRCRSGFRLEGSALRICLETGRWSGQEPKCAPKTCRPLKRPRNGRLECHKDSNATTSLDNPQVDTECEFSCFKGFRLTGSHSRTCLPVRAWSGLPTFCKPITCPRLRKPNYGEIYPSACGRRRTRHGQRCAFACLAGFQLQGSALRECGGEGEWTGSSARCVDTTPPSLFCPDNVVVNALAGKRYAVVRTKLPQARDNSGFEAVVQSVPVLPAREEAIKFKIGTTRVSVTAKDVAGNAAKCQFNVTVIDDQKPVVDFCASPPPFLINGDSDVATDVEWDEPIFHDNDPSKELNITSTRKFGDFSLGDTRLRYTAIDAAGNQAHCDIVVSVKGKMNENVRATQISKFDQLAEKVKKFFLVFDSAADFLFLFAEKFRFRSSFVRSKCHSQKIAKKAFSLFLQLTDARGRKILCTATPTAPRTTRPSRVS